MKDKSSKKQLPNRRKLYLAPDPVDEDQGDDEDNNFKPSAPFGSDSLLHNSYYGSRPPSE